MTTIQEEIMSGIMDLYVNEVFTIGECFNLALAQDIDADEANEFIEEYTEDLSPF